MAISFVGSAEASSSPNASTSVDLSGIALQADDLIIAALAVGDDDNASNNIAAPALTGVTFTEFADIAELTDADDVYLSAFYGYYSGSDTTLDWAAVGGTDAANASVVMVFRGVRLPANGGPLDASVVTAQGIDTAHPNPPSIDLSGTSGVWTVIIGATSHVLSGGTQTYVFPLGYTVNARDRSHADSNCVTIGMGYNSSPADPEDPGTMTFSGLSAATNSWAAVTMGLRAATEVNGRLDVSQAYLETPDQPDGRIDVAQAYLELPEPDGRLDISQAFLETPDQPDGRLDISQAGLEVPDAPAPDGRIDISQAYLETPDQPDGRLDVSMAFLEAPDPPARLDISQAYLETPDQPDARLDISYAALEIPSPDGRLDISMAYLQVPNVSGESTRTRRTIVLGGW